MTLAFDDHGRGRAIVLLHAFPLDHTLWKDQRDALSPRYRVICPDLPGHGRSPLLSSPTTVDGMADAILELLDTLAMTERVVLGGISMGGYVALSLAVRYPERLCGLMLFDTKSATDVPAAAVLREKNARMIETTGKTDDFIDGMLPKLLADATRQRNPDLIARLSKIMRETSPEVVSTTLRALASRPDRTDELAKIRVPTLITVGEHDAISPPAEMKAMAERIPHALFKIIPGSGHLPPIENPAAVNDAIGAFLSSLES